MKIFKLGKVAQVIHDDGIADGGERYTDEEMDLMEGKAALRDPDRKVSRRRFVHVLFDDGQAIGTTINGTKDEIESYYIGQEFEKSDETIHKATKVEFIS
jgi:hypothetical protein